MLKERNIEESWVEQVVKDPDRREEKKDGTVDFIGAIEVCGGRYLRVVVNPTAKPPRIVTVFFDRRWGRKQ